MPAPQPLRIVEAEVHREDEQIVIHPLGDGSRRWLNLILGMENTRMWYYGGASIDPESHLLKGLYFSCGGDGEAHPVIKDNCTQYRHFGDFELLIRFGGETDKDTAAFFRYICYNGGSRLRVHRDATVQRIVLVPAKGCRLCSDSLVLSEVTRGTCSVCIQACDHSYTDQVGVYAEGLAMMPVCESCKLVDPNWQPGDAAEEAARTVSDGPLDALVLRPRGSGAATMFVIGD